VVHHLGSVPGMIELLYQYALPLVAFGVCWWPCCGTPPPDCTVFEDNFDRSDSTNLGSDWTETTGNSTITSNALRFTTTNAVATCNTNSPNASRSIKADFSGSATNNIGRIVIGTHKIEVKCSATTGFIRLINPVGSVSESSATNLNFPVATSTPVVVCYDAALGIISASVPSVAGCSFTATGETVVGLTNGLGTGGTVSGSVSWDNFELLDINDDCSCELGDRTFGCPDCIDKISPLYMQVDVSGVTNDGCTNCSSLNGTYILPYDGIYEGGCNWVLDLVSTLTGCGSPSSRPTGLSVSLRSGAFHFINIHFTGRGTFVYNFPDTTDYDCLTLSLSFPSGVDYPGDTSCNFSGASATLTSL
jgi:hypothetical protein